MCVLIDKNFFQILFAVMIDKFLWGTLRNYASMAHDINLWLALDPSMLWLAKRMAVLRRC